MADLEEDAFKRDGRFIWRLILVMAVGVIAGLWMFAQLTGDRSQGCAAEAFSGVTGAPSGE